jgi:hypothetical protein
MICLDFRGGVFVPLQPQPAHVSGCAYVLQSGAEVTSNPFLMTQTEAAQIGLAISSLWVTVAVIRSVSRRFF